MPSEVVFRFSLLLILLIGGIVQQIYRYRHGQKRHVTNEPESQFRILFEITAYYIAMPLWVFAPKWFQLSQYQWPAYVRLSGLAVMIIGLVIWMWSQFTLGSNWSGQVVLREGHTLTTNGPYRWVRHPMYTAYIVLVIGFWMGSANVLVSLLFTLHIWFTISRVEKEELLMAKAFGKNFFDWRARTGRFFPKLF